MFSYSIVFHKFFYNFPLGIGQLSEFLPLERQFKILPYKSMFWFTQITGLIPILSNLQYSSGGIQNILYGK
jgi:hypothetical protein